MNKMVISPQGIQALKEHEALRLKAYDDGTGKWTIAYGHTGKVNGVPVGPGMTVTEQEAETLLKQRLPEFENAVSSSVKTPLTQNQFDALVSLAYNIGSQNFKNSTLVKKLNAGDVAGAAEQFGVWRKAGGKVMKGLINRRNKEREMFLGGEKINVPMPENQPPIYDNLNKPQIQPDTLLQAFNPEQAPAGQNLQSTPPLAPLVEHNSRDNDLVNTFEQLNGTHRAFSEPEPPKRDSSLYDKQLAEAFGIAPSTEGRIPDYIGEMIKSIYDQTA